MERCANHSFQLFNRLGGGKWQILQSRQSIKAKFPVYYMLRAFFILINDNISIVINRTHKKTLSVTNDLLCMVMSVHKSRCCNLIVHTLVEIRFLNLINIRKTVTCFAFVDQQNAGRVIVHAQMCIAYQVHKHFLLIFFPDLNRQCRNAYGGNGAISSVVRWMLCKVNDVFFSCREYQTCE